MKHQNFQLEVAHLLMACLLSTNLGKNKMSDPPTGVTKDAQTTGALGR